MNSSAPRNGIVRLLYSSDAIEVRLPAGARATVIGKPPLPKLADPAGAVAAALAQPIGSVPLAELVRGKRSACILICDVTRPVPNGLFLRPMIEAMLAAGVPRDELLSGKILLGGNMVEIIDLPGIYDLHGFSDDEQVVRHFLHDNVPDLALVIINTTQIERQMSLLLQLKQLNLNMVVLLNMADEAKKYGITIDTHKMTEALGIPIFLLSAKYGNGYKEAMHAVEHALRYSTPGLAENLRDQLKIDGQIEEEMARVLQHSVEVPARLPDNLTNQLDRLMLHPWLGCPCFSASCICFSRPYSSWASHYRPASIICSGGCAKPPLRPWSPSTSIPTLRRVCGSYGASMTPWNRERY